MDSIKEIEERIDAFNKARDWDQFHSPANLAKSIAIEAGELLECFQWDEKNYNLQDVSEELADVMNYCFQMAMVLGVDLKEIIMSKIEKTEKKYPVEKAKGKADKYTKL
ncbi:MAG: nucleotide pyrophosphohydrolase [Candidatus Enteromonas sp.]|nr:nucleotide pyrophosphohydrolase [Candidatus Enteromonas sp.]